MLAATISINTTEEAPVVHFINPSTGDSIPKPGLASHAIVAMGFIDQYFIAVSQPAAYVWDLINDTLMYRTKSKENNESRPTLTTDAVGGTFALATGVGDAGRTKIVIYSLKEPGCLYKHTFDVPIEGVLASNGAKGYTLLFADATIRTLSPAASRPLRALDHYLPTPEVGEQIAIEASAGEADEDVDAIKPLTTAGNEAVVSRRTVDDEEDDRPVVRPEQLANLFDTPQSFAMPPVQDMFAAVVGLFGRQPYLKPAVEAS
jgi:NET1-associated nuclear protein 1 (U3 small nucleolar RNA-associated protein 17)